MSQTGSTSSYDNKDSAPFWRKDGQDTPEITPNVQEGMPLEDKQKSGKLSFEFEPCVSRRLNRNNQVSSGSLTQKILGKRQRRQYQTAVQQANLELDMQKAAIAAKETDAAAERALRAHVEAREIELANLKLTGLVADYGQLAILTNSQPCPERELNAQGAWKLCEDARYVYESLQHSIGGTAWSRRGIQVVITAHWSMRTRLIIASSRPLEGMTPRDWKSCREELLLSERLHVCFTGMKVSQETCKGIAAAAAAAAAQTCFENSIEEISTESRPASVRNENGARPVKPE